jgi:transcriptional regulator with XRE-family HTH domain
MGSRQQYVYHTEPQEFPANFAERLDRFRQAAGFTWRGLGRELRVNAEMVRRWKAGSGVGSGHLVSLFALAARLGLLHHLLPEAGEPEAGAMLGQEHAVNADCHVANT